MAYFIASVTDIMDVNLITTKGNNYVFFVEFLSIFKALKKNWTGIT